MSNQKDPSGRPNKTADDFIKSIGSQSKNEATVALVDLLIALYRLNKSENAVGSVFKSLQQLATEVLKLQRIPNVELAIETFKESIEHED